MTSLPPWQSTHTAGGHPVRWRVVVVTERVPSQNHRTFPKFATAYTLSGSLRSPAPPQGEPRAAAPPGAHSLTLCAVTEKIPCSNLRIFPYLILRTPSQARFARQLSHRESQGRLRRRCFSHREKQTGCCKMNCSSLGGGPNRDRTDDLTDANRTLSQLSYRPISCIIRRLTATVKVKICLFFWGQMW